MGIESTVVDNDKFKVTVPFFRADILHECDIAEDIAIGFDINKITRTYPEASTVGKQVWLNKMTDLVRQEIGFCGFIECLNFVLCPEHEQTTLINNSDSSQIVRIQDAKMSELDSARSTLIEIASFAFWSSRCGAQIGLDRNWSD